MTTIISCPSCGAGYDIPDLDAIAGRKVRCRTCANVWRVEAVGGTGPDLEVSALIQSQIGGGGRPTAAMLSPDRDKAEARQAVAGGALSQAQVDEAPMKTIALGPRRAAVKPPEQANGHSRQPPGPNRAESHALASPGVSMLPASSDRRRLGRRSSGFDDVEAAIAALQSSMEEQAAPPVKADGLVRSQDIASRSDAPQPPLPPPQAGANGRPVNGADNYRPLSDAGLLDEDPFAPDIGFEDELRAKRMAAAVAWVVFLAVLGGLGAFAWFDRLAVVRHLPGLAPAFSALGAPVNARGLEFSGVDSQWQVDAHGRPVLSLTGQVKNVSREPQTVPTVVFAFLDADGRELFDWATPVALNSLPPGETMPFTTVVPAPPEAVRNVEIRFAKARR